MGQAKQRRNRNASASAASLAMGDYVSHLATLGIKILCENTGRAVPGGFSATIYDLVVGLYPAHDINTVLRQVSARVDEIVGDGRSHLGVIANVYNGSLPDGFPAAEVEGDDDDYEPPVSPFADPDYYKPIDLADVPEPVRTELAKGLQAMEQAGMHGARVHIDPEGEYHLFGAPQLHL